MISDTMTITDISRRTLASHHKVGIFLYLKAGINDSDLF